MSTDHAVCTEPKGFQIETAEALASLRGALARVIADLPVASARPLDLAQQLHLDKSLASKISRLVSESPELFDVAAYLPGKAALGVFLRAAKRNGVSESREAAVREALERLEDIAEHHAGDRASFNLMLNACATDWESPAAVAQRRGAFRSNSVMFGVQARVQYKLAIFGPSPVEGRMDAVRIRGFVGMRRLRPGIAWTLSLGRVVQDDGVPLSDDPKIRELAIGGGEGHQMLLRAFSSAQLPEIAVVSRPDGTIEERMLPGPAGNEGAFTLFSGDIVESVGPATRDSENGYAASVARVHTPAELLVFDCLIHESFTERDAAPDFGMYTELGSSPWPACGESKRLPIVTPALRLGRGTEGMHSVDVPRVREITGRAFESTRWSAAQFVHYRVRLAYPPIPCSAVVRIELPEA